MSSLGKRLDLSVQAFAAFADFPRKVDGGRIEQGSKHEDNVARSEDGEQRRKIVHADEGKDGEQHTVDELAHERGAVVP